MKEQRKRASQAEGREQARAEVWNVGPCLCWGTFFEAPQKSSQPTNQTEGDDLWSTTNVESY